MSYWRSHAESVIHSSRIFRNSRMSLRKRLLSEAWGLKVKQIVDTFENLRFQLKKVRQIVNTLEKVILKVKKTDGFLKFTCRKCDRGLRNSRSKAKTVTGVSKNEGRIKKHCKNLVNLKLWSKRHWNFNVFEDHMPNLW